MGQTVAEKIISNHTNKKVYAGEICICNIDHMIASDTTTPIAISEFKRMGGKKVAHSDKLTLFMDHASPSPNQRISNLHQYMRNFSKEQSIKVYEQGEGICHQLIVENRIVKSGDLVIGADSHTCTYGALGALSTGVGSTDLAGAMLTGKTWMLVPETIKLTFKNRPNKNIYSKDIILSIIKLFKSNGANYQCIEFYGEYLDEMSLSEKLTLTNMVVEMGAKFGVICDAQTQLSADVDAKYSKEVDIDLSLVEAMVSQPHSVDNVIEISKLEQIKIDQVFLGSCTNGRLEDLRIARNILKSKKIHEGITFIVTPASKKIYLDAIKEGIIQDLMESGAIVTSPGCGLCVGTLGGIPSDDRVVISSSNRNFKGRMGNNKALIYLASPATLASSALSGHISSYRGDDIENN